MTVVVGPSAVGKGTVVTRLCQQYPQVWVSVSATTRPPRPGEVDGRHYHFVDESAFDAALVAGDMLEWAIVHGHYRYGTPRRPVIEAIAAGRAVLLEIDLQGARQVRQTMPSAHFVFLAPPDWTELVRRLTERGTESAAERRHRLASARAEMKAMGEFDVVIVNREIDQTAAELAAAMKLV